ncbi:MAG: hypothetical protein WAT67_11705 [Candidatus Contendobacter sp.]
MTTITFDTLAYVKTLREAGVEERQAEAQATALTTVLQATVATLDSGNTATKGDVEQVRTELKKDLEVVRAELKKDIELLRAEVKRDLAETKADLIRWVVGVGILQTTLLVGILARLAKVI